MRTPLTTAAVLLLTSTAVAAPTEFFTVSRDDDQLRIISVSGSTVGGVTMTLAGETINGANGLARDPTTHTLYAILKIQGDGSVRRLVTVNKVTGVATSIGSLGDSFAGITFDESGNLFGVTGDGATTSESLFSINKATAATSLLTGLGNGSDGESIAVNLDDGLLYHASGLGGGSQVFETVGPSPGFAVTDVPFSGDDLSEVFSLVYTRDGATFYGTNLNDELFSLSPTGVGSVLGGLDHSAKGIVVNPEPSSLAMFGLAGLGLYAARRRRRRRA